MVQLKFKLDMHVHHTQKFSTDFGEILTSRSYVILFYSLTQENNTTVLELVQKQVW